MYSKDFLKKRILVFGCNGLLGQGLAEHYKQIKDVNLLCSSLESVCITPGVDHVQCDITKRDEVKSVILDFYPDIIINAAAYTNVDKSEVERELAWKVNVKALEFMSEAARIADIHIISISSDYVFDGKAGPYSEVHRPNPLGYYGRTKLAGENTLKISGANYSIIRTNVLFGSTNSNKLDFAGWVQMKLENNEQISIVDDQINNPTSIMDLVNGIALLVESQRIGIYNIGGKDLLSRYEFALRIAKFYNLPVHLIKRIKTIDLNQPAPRPLKSGLLTLKAEIDLNYKPHSIEEVLLISNYSKN